MSSTDTPAPERWTEPLRQAETNCMYHHRMIYACHPVRRAGLGILAFALLLSGAPAAGHPPADKRLIEITQRLALEPPGAASRAPLLLRRAEIHRALEDHEAALADCNAAERLEPELARVELVRARVLLDLGQITQALGELNRYLHRRPDDPTGLALRARTRFRLDRPLAAAHDFRLAIAAARANESVPGPVLYLEQAGALRLANRPDAALGVLETATAHLGTLTVLERKAVEIEMATGRTDAALSRLARLDRTAEESGWGGREAWLALRGEILESIGRREEARGAYLRALAILDRRPLHRRTTRALGALEQTLRGALVRLGDGAVVPPREGRPTGGAEDRPPSPEARSGIAESPSTEDRGSASVTRGPYLQLATPTSVRVRWRTAQAVVGRVRFAPAEEPDAPERTAEESAARTSHEVELTGLEPSTRYTYSLEGADGARIGSSFVTPPPIGGAEPFRVWVLGDSGTADENARAVADAFRSFADGEPPRLWLMLGDNAYTDGTDDEYQRAVFETYPEELAAAPLWPALGNHDARSADSATGTGVYYDIFTLPRLGEAGGVPSGTEAYYSFDVGTTHFICLDSHDSDRSADGPMLTWLADDLMATDARWIIAFWHHPPYSKGSHDSDSELRLIEMRREAVPVLEDFGVDLVLAGHSHSYERSVLLDGHYGSSESLSPEMVLDRGDGNPFGSGAYLKPLGRPHEGAVYVVAGSSGTLGGGSLDHPVMHVSRRELGSLVLDIDGRRLDATFLETDARLTDTFTLLKGPPVPPEEMITDADFPGFRFAVVLSAPAAGSRIGAPEPACLPEALCISGALPGRTEVILRIVGPKPNGYLWPTLAKLTTSTVDVWIEQIETGELRYYRLEGASPGSGELPGLFDRKGFRPVGELALEPFHLAF